MSVVSVGLNHRTAPLDVLERMAVLPASLAKALHDLSGRDHLAEVVVLSTCNRTEVYAVATKYHAGMSDLRNFLADWSGEPPEAFSDDLYSYYDEGAISHLFRVAGGLDSAVLGESEILRQVRDAWTEARAEGACGPILDLLFRQAVETGKRVRSETAISRGTTSLSQAAVELASARLGGLEGQVSLVVGAGQMGESVSTVLGAIRGAGPVLVANRTWEKAVALAERAGGQAVRWNPDGSGLQSVLSQVDVVFTSTGSQESVLDAQTVAAAMAARPARPLLLVDIAVPRDIDPAVGQLPEVTLLDMDDVRAYADVAVASRRAELPKAEAIVAAEVARSLEVAAQRQMAPLVAQLHERAETIRAGELARYGARLSDLDERQRRNVEALTKAIVAKVLHDPTVRLKASAGTPAGEQLSAALRQLFEL